MCGGTKGAYVDAGVRKGLSPRVRGNPARSTGRACVLRSIPACAGEPMISGCSQKPGQVYPRVCGGTRVPPPTRFCTSGLSPRVRGNQRQAAHPGQ